MKNALLPLAAIPLLLAAPAMAQDHDHHAGHAMPVTERQPATPPTEDHGAHHGMGHHDMDHDEGHRMEEGTPAPLPPVPADHAADAIFGADAMARSRTALAHENGGMAHNMVLIDQLEAQTGKGADGYRWAGEAWFGGDINRLTIKTEGEGRWKDRLDSAEVQALWSHAIDPWFNLQAGLRQDIRPTPTRSYAVVGVEGLAPYWFKVEGALFLSDKGDLFGRVEASHDMRLTQRLILTPRAEFNFAAQGKALREAELGARLHYMIEPRFTPYVGIEWRGVHGAEAREMRAEGDKPRAMRTVAGMRFWF